MPGANCSIYNCSTSRKDKGIAIFKNPAGDDDFNRKWRENLVNIITRDRVIDQNLQRQINENTLHTCEHHYTEDCLLRNPKKTTRKPGSLPIFNNPVKSFSKPNKERSTSSISNVNSLIRIMIFKVTNNVIATNL